MEKAEIGADGVSQGGEERGGRVYNKDQAVVRGRAFFHSCDRTDLRLQAKDREWNLQGCSTD